MSKLKPKDAIYWNLVALSALEHGGMKVDELNDLAMSRMEEHRPRPQLQFNGFNAELENSTANSVITYGHSSSVIKPVTSISSTPQNSVLVTSMTSDIDEPDKYPGSLEIAPKYPFRRLHDLADSSDTVENPFDQIATRTPTLSPSFAQLQTIVINPTGQYQQSINSFGTESKNHPESAILSERPSEKKQSGIDSRQPGNRRISNRLKAWRYIIKRNRQMKSEWASNGSNSASEPATVREIVFIPEDRDNDKPDQPVNEDEKMKHSAITPLSLPSRIDS